MFRLIRWLFVLLLCLVAVGLYRGWFSFSSHSDKATDQTNLDVSFDKKKVKEDVHKMQRKIGQEVIELRGKAKQQESK